MARVVHVFGRQRAEDAFEAARQVDVHVHHVGREQVIVACEPEGRVDDVDIAHEFDVLDVRALEDHIVVAIDVNEPRQLPVALGNPEVVIRVVVDVVVDADDERAGVLQELPPRITVGREFVAARLIGVPHVGVDEVVEDLEDGARGVGGGEVGRGTEPVHQAAQALPTALVRLHGVELRAAVLRVAQAGVFQKAVHAHDDLDDLTIVGQEVGGDGELFVVREVEHHPRGEVHLGKVGAAAEHFREVHHRGVRGVLAHFPVSQGVGRGKTRCAEEHALEVGYPLHIPVAQVVGVGHHGGAFEHGFEVLRGGGVPGEVVGGVDLAHMVEHEAEVGNVCHVPVANGGERGEVGVVVEGVGQVGEDRGEPAAHARGRCQRGLAVEEVAHAGNVRGVQVHAVEAGVGSLGAAQLSVEPGFHGLGGYLAFGRIRAEGGGQVVVEVPLVLRAHFGGAMLPAGNACLVGGGPVVGVFHGGVLVERADGERLSGELVEPPDVAVGVEVAAGGGGIPRVGVDALQVVGHGPGAVGQLNEDHAVGGCAIARARVAHLKLDRAVEPGDVRGGRAGGGVVHDPAAFGVRAGGDGAEAGAVEGRACFERDGFDGVQVLEHINVGCAARPIPVGEVDGLERRGPVEEVIERCARSREERGVEVRAVEGLERGVVLEPAFQGGRADRKRTGELCVDRAQKRLDVGLGDLPRQRVAGIRADRRWWRLPCRRLRRLQERPHPG